MRSRLLVLLLLAAGCAASAPEQSRTVPGPPARVAGSERSWSKGLGSEALESTLEMVPTDWNSRPWLEAFREKVFQKWTAPLSYHAGLMIGEQRVKLVIGLSGELISLEILEQQGDPELARASENAFRDSAPFSPLPKPFPEEILVLYVNMRYPRVDRR